MTEQAPKWGEEKVVAGVVALPKDPAETVSAQSVAKEYLTKLEQPALTGNVLNVEVL